MAIGKVYKLVYLLSTLIFFGLLASVVFYFKGSTNPAPVKIKYQPAEQVVQLSATFADPIWNGVAVPEGQQCRKFEGDGVSPSLNIEDIPSGADTVLLEFGDLTYEPMLNGGHGIIGMALADGSRSIVFPSVPAETTVLPEGVYIESPHRSDRGEAGGYLPPCSGGIGNTYYVDVKAIRSATAENEMPLLLGEARLIMGKY